MAYQEKDKVINLQSADKKSTLDTAGDRLGTYYLTDNPKHYEIQRGNNFVFYVEGLNKLLGNTDYSLQTANKYAYENPKLS